MGNVCCLGSSNCDSVEERSGLLPGGIKVPASSSESGEIAELRNGTEVYSEIRTTGGEVSEACEENKDTSESKQEGPSLSFKNDKKEETFKSQTIEKNGLLSSSPITTNGLVVNTLCTAPDKCSVEKATATTDKGLTANTTPVEPKRCSSDPQQSPSKGDAGEGAAQSPNEHKDTGELVKHTFATVHDKHSEEIRVTCPEPSPNKVKITPEDVTPETAVEVSTLTVLHNAGMLQSEPKCCCTGAVVVTSLPETHLSLEPSEDSCEASLENCLASAVVTVRAQHFTVSSNTAMEEVGDESMSSVADLDNDTEQRYSSQEAEPSPSVREAAEPTQNILVTQLVSASPPRTNESQNLCEDKMGAGQCGLTEVPSLEYVIEDEVPETKQDEEMEERAPETEATPTEMGGGEGQKGESHERPSTVADVTVNERPSTVADVTVNERPSTVADVTVNERPSTVADVTVNERPSTVADVTVNERPSIVADVTVNERPVRDEDNPVMEDLDVSEEDLYQGADELSQEPVQHIGSEQLLEIALPKVEDRCSLEPTVDILSYSEREWKGNTAKSILVRKGYTELSRRFESLRRVRGDNYCALRATLFQVFSSSTQLPVWLQEEHIITWLEDLKALVGQWVFPSVCRLEEGCEDVIQQLKRYMKLLQNRWEAAVGCSSEEERQHLCECIFQGGEEELGLLEALKLLMLVRASELHTTMQAGGDVPVFCWLMFARDSSDCPRTFFSNHLSQVGFSGGLEQVEMFLLGYALRCTIQVYRLYMADTDEYVTFYPDDHKEDWPTVCLVTEDDRHYNVPVGQPNGLQTPEDTATSLLELTAD
ncbi:hypothetical protein UPYG_G00078420 [Umbra pygmaea]|uniref:Uncharacterized protein n=1 Tax=Umbra pygmaea TaxID=75934 RepID=A0ABD0XSS2_UMBPY